MEQGRGDRLLAAVATRRGRRVLSVSAGALLVAAAALLGAPVVTDLQHDHLQSHLRHQLASPSLRSAYVTGTVREGDSLTRLTIPKLGVDVVVVQGTGESALRAGAGHYPETPLPCTAGDVAIAGHRTTYGKPFANINLLAPGDVITLATPVGSCVYRVDRAPFVVANDDWAVVANTPGQATLTLTSCHPRGSAAQRIVIKATMVSSEVLS